MESQTRRIAVVGATGYIGSRLVPLLLERGHEVTAVVRDASRLTRFPWSEQTRAVEADALEIESLPSALRGQDLLYYLVHSMGAAGDFARKDRQAASNVALVAAEERVGRIVYLSGLGRGENLSEHLASRQEVGRVLGERGVSVTEFRAAVVVGAESASFKMVRYLAERLPLMLTPRWVRTRVQPIAERDVLRYLSEAPDREESTGRVLEIGGVDVLTYGEMITRYARLRGLKRVLIPVPVLTPALSSYWVNLVTPVPSSVARPLIEGVRNEVVVVDDAARRIFPFEPLGYEAAIREALAAEAGRETHRARGR